MIVQLDMSGWDQNRINMTHAMIISLLANNNINYTNIIKMADNKFDIKSNASDSTISNLVTRSNLESAYDAWKTDADAETASVIQTYNTRLAEYESNIFVTTSYENIDAYIDGLSTLAELKALLKKMAKALKFKLIK